MIKDYITFLEKKLLFVEKRKKNQKFDLILSNLPASDKVLQYSTRNKV